MSFGRRSSFAIQCGTSTPSHWGNSKVFKEPQTENVQNRHRLHVLGGTLVAIVRDQVLRSVDVVDDLGDKEGAACSLFCDEPEVLIARARVPLGDRDSAWRQVRRTSVRSPAPRQRGCARDEAPTKTDSARAGILLRSHSTESACLLNRAVNDGRHVQVDEVTSEVVGRVDRRSGRSLGLRLLSSSMS